MADKLDIIVLGATGFTGRHTLAYVHKLASTKSRHLSWGVAGRNEKKLRADLMHLEKQTNDSKVFHIPIIVADLTDDSSLYNMACRARLIINCCGPFKLLGEKVVRACVEAGTHHIDISGESSYMEDMHQKYNEKAKKKGIYIVSACGVDSIPCDLGVIFLQKKFEGTLNSVETYLNIVSDDESLSGPTLNSGTWQSAVYGVPTLYEILFPKRWPALKPSLDAKMVPFKAPVHDKWAVVFPGSDRPVALQTQRYMLEKKKQRPAQIQTYFLLKNLRQLLSLVTFGILFFIMAKFKLGRNLLLKYPDLFSLGFFSNSEPSEEVIQKTEFSITLVGKGWKEKLAGPDDQYTKPPNKGIIAEVKGKNPGYGSTCICVVLSGIVILTESSKLPKEGGVYSPGACFAETTLIEQLNDNGVTFKLLKEFDVTD